MSTATTTYIRLPSSQKTTTQDGGSTELDVWTFLDQFCWGDPAWRKDEASFMAQERLTALFDEAKEKGWKYVACKSTDFAIMQPLAALKERRIDGPNARPLTRLAMAFGMATTKKPDDFDQQETPATSTSPTNGEAKTTEANA